MYLITKLVNCTGFLNMYDEHTLGFKRKKKAGNPTSYRTLYIEVEKDLLSHKKKTNKTKQNKKKTHKKAEFVNSKYKEHFIAGRHWSPVICPSLYISSRGSQ